MAARLRFRWFDTRSAVLIVTPSANSHLENYIVGMGCQMFSQLRLIRFNLQIRLFCFL